MRGQMASADSSVSSAGFHTNVQPTANAEHERHAHSCSGKFQGEITPTTPTGVRS